MLGALALASVLALSPAATAMGAATLLQGRAALGIKAFVTGTSSCATFPSGEAARFPLRAGKAVAETPPSHGTSRCFAIVAHVVVDGDAPVQSSIWFAEQVAQANRLFAEIDVAFEVREVREVAAELANIDSRSQRDNLGRGEDDAGVVHVWVVRRLADVDIEGDEIRGVHWRDRADTTRRFIILSSIAGDRTLAHELGHFFGLPHSTYPASIMNKSPRDDPPWELRGFVEQEYKKMRGRRDAMVADGTLVDRAKRRR